MASRKLRPYFQANPIIVMMDQPIKRAMKKPEALGRMVQWVIELSQFDIEYYPRTAIKAQVLADFIAEFTDPKQEENHKSFGWSIRMARRPRREVEQASSSPPLREMF